MTDCVVTFSSSASHLHSSVQTKLLAQQEHLAVAQLLTELGLVAPHEHQKSSPTEVGAGGTFDSTGTKLLFSLVQSNVWGSGIIGCKFISCSYTAAWQCARRMCSVQAPSVGGNTEFISISLYFTF